METSIRVGSKPFFGAEVFPCGLSRSGYFNKRESQELIEYGNTFAELQHGILSPINEEEFLFLIELNDTVESTLYPVKLWKKYLHAVQKSRTFHGFSPSSRFQAISLEEDSINDDLDMELAG
ncbi:DUF413 domain-containing protein [Thalassotalea sediminis]|uniref:DUF413 domain-containing protein n=1 Tax=Thalassotalea sediminis TaxID=1759089 RepID=UPI0025739506|nr:DUF413 domain-containing protein [Thalassotalea sediminis]